MLKHRLIYISLLSAVVLTGCSGDDENIETFGAEEWTQYRMHSDRNAVMDSGLDPLVYKR